MHNQFKVNTDDKINKIAMLIKKYLDDLDNDISTNDLVLYIR